MQAKYDHVTLFLVVVGWLLVGCWLVVGWLLVVGCWLLVVGCWLLVVGCLLLLLLVVVVVVVVVAMVAVVAARSCHVNVTLCVSVVAQRCFLACVAAGFLSWHQATAISLSHSALACRFCTISAQDFASAARNPFNMF